MVVIRKMNVWIIFVGETLPIDEVSREWRYGMLADSLIKKGHNVVRWAPTFNHTSKKQRKSENSFVKINDNYSINLVYNVSYKKNISIRRLISYMQFSKGLRKHFLKATIQPDIIITGLPSPNVCKEVVDYANKFNIPIVVDVRDLWPDTFVRIFPNIFSFFINIYVKKMHKINEYIFNNVDSITAISKTYIDWALKYRYNNEISNFKIFYIGYNLDDKNIKFSDFENSLIELGIDNKCFICCFFGTIGRHFDFITLIDTAKILLELKINVQFVICGIGEKLSYLRDVSKELKNIIFPGWLDKKQILLLMKWSKIGLAPYLDGTLFSLPNKPFEYLAGGLIIASSLKGELAEIIDENNCGFTYDAGSSEQLANAILDLYHDPKKLSCMSRNAIELFRTKFAGEEIYPNMVGYLERIVSNKLSRTAP